MRNVMTSVLIMRGDCVSGVRIATIMHGFAVLYIQVLKNIKNVAGCRDTRTAKSKETRGMIEHNSEVYNHPYISFFIVHVYMEEDLCMGDCILHCYV